MSIVLITEHNETIYDLIKSKSVAEKKPTRRKSRIRSDGGKRKDQSKRTMGPEPEKNVIAVPPAENEYNRKPKSARKTEKPKPKPQPRVCMKAGKLPDLPWKEEQNKTSIDEDRLKAMDGPGIVLKKLNIEKPGAGLIVRREMDFIKNNAVIAKKMKPKEYQLKTTRMEPKYVYKKDFGKFPPYLIQRTKAKSNRMMAMKDKSIAASEKSKCRYVKKDERDELLAGLKRNWDELQKEFQSLPVLTDTTPKILRKINLETKLKQLEDDILLIERHPYIYVYDDENSASANYADK